MISDTRRRLKEWGAWARGGEPTVSSMWNSMFGRGAQVLGETPLYIREVDLIVCRAEVIHRAVLIQFYTRSGGIRDKALFLGIPTMTFHDRVRQAEWYVNSELECSLQPVRNSV